MVQKTKTQAKNIISFPQLFYDKILLKTITYHLKYHHVHHYLYEGS